MNGAVFGGLVRAALAAAGGWLVGEGLASESDAAGLIESGTDFVCGVIGIGVTVLWSWWAKRKGGVQ
jgi:membrane protein DedA with SNARE-associated domain